jgi:hypothetical protein
VFSRPFHHFAKKRNTQVRRWKGMGRTLRGEPSMGPGGKVARRKHQEVETLLADHCGSSRHQVLGATESMVFRPALTAVERSPLSWMLENHFPLKHLECHTLLSGGPLAVEFLEPDVGLEGL